MLQKILSEKMRIARAKKKTNQEEASLKAGLSLSTWQNIENLKTDPSLGNVEKILNSLGLTVEIRENSDSDGKERVA